LEPALAPALAATEAEPVPLEAAASPPVEAEAAPMAAAIEQTAREPVQGPAVQPRSVDELAADAPRRSGWWRR
jgi:ribonuclease E